MVMKILALVLLVSVSQSALSADKDDYKYCTSAGYWLGFDEAFMGQLAAHIVVKRGLNNDPVCKSAWKVANEAAKRIRHEGFRSEEDVAVAQQANEMSKKVYDYIEAAAGL